MQKNNNSKQRTRKWLSFISIMTALSVTTISGLFVGLNINHQQLSSNSSNSTLNNNVELASNKDARTVLPTDFEDEIKSDSTIYFPDKSTAWLTSNQMATTKKGVFITMNNSPAILLDTNTNKVVWKLKRSDGSDSVIGSSASWRVLCTKYNPDISPEGSSGGSLLILSLNSSARDKFNVLLSLVDADTGTIYDQTAFSSHRFNSSDFSMYLYPIQNTIDQYLLISRSSMETKYHNQTMVEITISSSEITTNPITSYDPNDSRSHAVFSAGAFKVDNDVYLAQIEWWGGSANSGKNVYISVYKNYKVVGRDKIINSLDIGSDWYSNVNIAEIKIRHLSGTQYALFALFKTTHDGNRPHALCYTFDISNNTFTRNYSVELNSDNADYDIRTGYYDSSVDKFITYCSYIKPLDNDSYSGPGIVVFDLNDIDNSDFTLNGGQVRVFLTRDGDAFRVQDRYIDFFPFLTTYGNFEEGNLLLTKSSWTTYALFDISKYSEGTTWRDYHYAYWTRPKDDVIPIDGVSDVNLLGLNSSSLNGQYQNQFLQYFTQYTQNNTTVGIANSYEGNLDPQSYSVDFLTNIYQGQAPVTLYCNGIVYNKNGQYLNISNGDESSYCFNNITLTGFYKWTTSVNADVDLNISNENATNDEYVTQYVKDHVNEIFKDLPLDFDANTNVVGVTLDKTNPLNVSCTITLNKWIDENGILQETEEDFYLGVININTYVKDEYLNGTLRASDANLDSILPQELYLSAYKDDANIISLSVEELKIYIGSEFFLNTDNRRPVQVKDIVFGDFDNVNGTLVMEKAIISNYYENGVFCSGDDFVKEIELNTTITGLERTIPTTINSEFVLPEGSDYNVKNITDQQIVDLINDAANELVEPTPDFKWIPSLIWNKEKNFFVDASSIVRDTINNTISINVATNSYYAGEKAVYTTFPYLTQTITISGFTPIETLATTINEAQLDQNGGVFDVSTNSVLANLNVNNITGNEAELLQFIIDNNIFENLPEQFTIQNITDITIGSRIDGSITINSITINKYLNETGTIVEENKTFDLTITLEGFNGAELGIGESTYLTAPINGNTSIASDSLPSALDAAQAKTALIALLNDNKNNFMNLPSTITTFDDTNVLVVDQVADNQNGSLTINFTLSSLLINGQTTNITQDDINDISNDFIFSATLNGFKTLNLWTGLNTTIDYESNNIFTYVNEGELNQGYNYKEAIKTNLITYLDTFGEEETVNALKEYINSEAFISDSNFALNYDYSDLDNSTIVVTNTQLDTLSGSTMWSNGVVFNVTNAFYLKTNATLKSSYDPTNGGSATLSDFKASIDSVNINDVATFTNLPTDNFSSTDDCTNPDLITLSVVNEKDNTAQLAVTFKSYFDEHGIINDYTMVFDQVFTFASEQNNESVSLVESIDAMDLRLDTYNSYQLVAALNQGNAADINSWLQENKNLIVDPDTNNTQDITLTFDNAIVDSTNNTQVILNVVVNGNQYHTFTITNLTRIVATNIAVKETIAPDVNASNISSYFDSNVNEKAKSFINWNTDAKLPFATDTVATVISAQVFNLTLNSDGSYQVYINFIFNGVYLSNNNNITYQSNYLYQIMIDNLPATSNVSNSAAKIIATNNTDHFVNINNNLPSANTNLPIILIATLSTVILLILLSVTIYMFCVKNKNKK